MAGADEKKIAGSLEDSFDRLSCYDRLNFCYSSHQCPR